MSKRNYARVPLLLAVVFALVATLFASLGAQAQTDAPVEPSFRRADTGAGHVYAGGPGHTRPVYAKTWNSNGRKGLCFRFTLSNPNSSGAHKVTSLPGMTLSESRRAFYITNTYATTTSNNHGAAASLAVWVLEGSPNFTKKWFPWAKKNKKISQTVLNLMTRILAESALRTTPLKMSLSANAVLVGQNGSLVAKVVNAAGKPIPRVRVTAVASRAKLSRTVATTGTSGQATFGFERTNVGRTGFSATYRTPSALAGWVSHPASGNQSLVLNGEVDTGTAHTSFDKFHGTATIKQTCDTDCDGWATVTLRDCTSQGEDAVRWFISADGSPSTSFDVPGNSRCATKTKRYFDATKLSFEFCYIDKVGSEGKCTTPTTKKPDKEVVCPPWATADFAAHFACDKCTIKYVSFEAPAGSKRYYKGYYTLNGQTTYINLTNGEPLEVVLNRAVADGATIVLGFRVYRDSARTSLLKSVKLGSGTVSVG